MQIPTTPSTLVHTAAVSAMPTMTSRVDPEGARRMMEMLSNMYSDPKLACVREYVANAVDATRMAGTGIPVDVTIPTLLEPNLVIADHGTGMSMAEVERTFLAFAASTKRDSNDQIGGLGVGAKSAWSISESFLIDTVKDGERTIVRAAKDLTHQVVVAGEVTDLPNGTTISIPIKNISGSSTDWAKRVMEVATAHDPGTVNVNGKPVVSIASAGRIGPVLCARVHGHDTSFLVRSGGTLFDSTYTLTNRIRSKVKLSGGVIDLPIGSFDHTPSREQLMDTERTRDAIDRALEMYETAYASLKERLEALAQTDITAAVKLRQEILGDTASYDVLQINMHLQVPATIGAWVARNAWKTVSDHDKDTFFATTWDSERERTIIVTGVPAGKKLRTFARYLKNSGHYGVRRVIPIPAGQNHVALLVSDKSGPISQVFNLDATMVPEDNAYTWERWLEVTASTRTGSRGPKAGYKCVVITQDDADPKNQELSAAEIVALGLPIWYDTDDSYSNHIVQKASVGVHLGKRKVETLLKAIPGAVSVREWHQATYAAELNSWSHTTKLALALQSRGYYMRRFKLAAKGRDKIVSAGRIPLDVLNKVAEMTDAVKALTKAQIATWDRMRSSAASGRFQTLFDELDNIDNLLVAAWPLLKHAGYDTSEDGEYINYIAQMPAKV